MRAKVSLRNPLFSLLAAAAALAVQAEAVQPLQGSLSATALVSDQLSREPGVEDRGAVLTVSPGLFWRSQQGRVRGQVDYALHLNAPIRVAEPQRRATQQLRANVRADAWSNRLGLDANALVGQQAVSAFGAQGPTQAGQSQANQRETASLQLSPQFRARVAGVAELSLRHTHSMQRTRDSLQGDQIGRLTALALQSATGGALQGGLSLSQQVARPTLGRDTRSELAQLNLAWRPDVDWALRANGGHERSDVLGAGQRSGATYGGGLEWRPSERTRLDVGADRRVAAQLYKLNFEHRIARSAWRLSASRTLNQPGVVGAAGQLTRYELLFNQYASLQPDPVLRDAMVREELTRLGLSLDAPATAGFLSSSPSLTRSVQAGWNWSGLRTTISGQVQVSHTSRLGAAVPGEDLALSSLVRQRGGSITVTQRLTPRDSLSAVLSHQQTAGDSAAQQTTLNAAQIGWTSQLGPRRQLSLSLRHADFDAVLRPYTENAFLATLTQQF